MSDRCKLITSAARLNYCSGISDHYYGADIAGDERYAH